MRHSKGVEFPFLPLLTVLQTPLVCLHFLVSLCLTRREHCCTCCLYHSSRMKSLLPCMVLFQCFIFSVRMQTHVIQDESQCYFGLRTSACQYVKASQYLMNTCVNHNLVLCLLLTSKSSGSVASLHRIHSTSVLSRVSFII